MVHVICSSLISFSVISALFFMLLITLINSFIPECFLLSSLSLSFSSSVSVPLHSFVADSSSPLLVGLSCITCSASFLLQASIHPCNCSMCPSIPTSKNDSNLNYAVTLDLIYKWRADWALMSYHASAHSVTHIHTWELQSSTSASVSSHKVKCFPQTPQQWLLRAECGERGVCVCRF